MEGAFLVETLTADELRELSMLFSSLLSEIHSLSTGQTQMLLAVDEHMRGDSLTTADLEALRRLSHGNSR